MAKMFSKICGAFSALALPKISKYFEQAFIFGMAMSAVGNVSRQPILGKLQLSE